MTEELISRAMAAVEAVAPRAAQDPARPLFHFRPPARWMSDVCAAFYHYGYHHAFFQFNPWGDDKPGPGTGWGHARSEDLVRWEFLPPALLPSEEDDEIGAASGSAYIRADGVPMLFFTHTPSEFPEKKREPWGAIPADDQLLDWRRIDIGLAAGRSGVPEDIHPRWADMFVFKHGDRVFATFKQSDGLLCEAQNEELTSWKAVGNLGGTDTDISVDSRGVGGECPNFFSLQGHQVLIRSTYPISYMIGEFDPDAVEFSTRVGPRVLDHAYGGKKQPDHYSRGLYGTTVFLDSAGRAVLLGWVSGFRTGRGWNGCMSLPRVLSIENDKLIQTPLPELQKLRGYHTHLEELVVDSTSTLIDGADGDTLEIVAEVDPRSATACGLKVRCDSNGNEGLSIAYHGKSLDVAGTVVPLDLNDGETLKLRLYLDKSVMELFIQNGSASVTRVDYPTEGNMNVFVFAENGSALVQSLDVWQMSSIW